MHLGLKLILWGCFDPGDEARGDSLDPTGHEVGGIRRPLHFRVIGVVFGAVPAQAHGFSASLGSQEQVVLDEFDRPFPVG